MPERSAGITIIQTASWALSRFWVCCYDWVFSQCIKILSVGFALCGRYRPWAAVNQEIFDMDRLPENPKKKALRFFPTTFSYLLAAFSSITISGPISLRRFCIKRMFMFTYIFNAEFEPRTNCCFTIKLSILTFAAGHLTQNTLAENYSWISSLHWTLTANSFWMCIRLFSNPDIRTSLKDMTSTLDWETDNKM